VQRRSRRHVGRRSARRRHGCTRSPGPVRPLRFSSEHRSLPHILTQDPLTDHRPDLAWRDVQHLMVRGVDTFNDVDPDWETTATGRKFNYKCAFSRSRLVYLACQI